MSDVIYQAPSGQVIRFGRAAPPSVVPSDLSGGTVNQLLAGWSGTGFQLLTTAPASSLSSAFSYQAHGGTVWDEDRQMMWLHGANSHSTATDMVNTVFRWQVSDGLFHRCGPSDAYPGEYRMSAEGVVYADAAKTRPGAGHTYRTMLYLPGTREIMCLSDYAQHESAPAINEGTVAFADRRKPIWYYSTVTGTFRTEWDQAIQDFVGRGVDRGVAYVPGYGYYKVAAPSIHRLSDDRQMFTTSGNYLNTASTRYHCYGFAYGTRIVIFGGGTSSDILCSVHDVADLPGTSRKELISTFPALAPYGNVVQWAAQMPDGRIVFGMQTPSPYEMGAYIYDPATSTVVDTGARLTGMTKGSTEYGMQAEWSVQHGCVIFVSDRFSGNARVYAMRP